MRYPVNSGSIEVLKGDIADQDTDAIVNAANNHFWMGSGVAGAIKRKGGVIIEREAVDQGPVDIGKAVITSAGSLKARHVIHAAVMGQDLHTNAAYIKEATHNALHLAEKELLTSISFPALGTGVGGFSLFHCAKIMITEAIEFLLTSEHMRHICFILFDDDAYQAFEQELKLQFSAKRH